MLSTTSIFQKTHGVITIHETSRNIYQYQVKSQEFSTLPVPLIQRFEGEHVKSWKVFSTKDGPNERNIARSLSDVPLTNPRTANTKANHPAANKNTKESD